MLSNIGLQKKGQNKETTFILGQDGQAMRRKSFVRL